jgi:phosphatidylethanolamine-binding protein (PEBP) family uncharacterized protein
MEKSSTPIHAMRRYLAIGGLLLSVIAPVTPSAFATTSTAFQAEVWVDNWFSLYVDGKKVGQDSVQFNTEKSFNSSIIKFTATYPFEVGVVARDYIENDSGLEYIGKSNQQIGDAGFIMQIREVKTGKIVSTSSSKWRSLVIQRAPLNIACVSSKNPVSDCKSMKSTVPSGWTLKTFKDSAWKSSTEFSKEDVGVKDGFFDFTWNSAAQLIWSSDLKLDNTVLFRTLVTGKTETAVINSSVTMTLSSPDFIAEGTLPASYTCDGVSQPPSLAWSNVPNSAKSLVLIMNTVPGPPRPGETESTSHAYLILYNIPASTKSALPNGYPGNLGMNFKDKLPGYTAPCSQGPGAKKYTFTLYALSSTLNLPANEASEMNVKTAMQSKVISQAELSAYYTRP